MKLLRRVSFTVIIGLLAALTYAASTSATDSLVLIVSQAGRDTAKLNFSL